MRSSEVVLIPGPPSVKDVIWRQGVFDRYYQKQWGDYLTLCLYARPQFNPKPNDILRINNHSCRAVSLTNIIRLCWQGRHFRFTLRGAMKNYEKNKPFPHLFLLGFGLLLLSSFIKFYLKILKLPEQNINKGENKPYRSLK